MKYILRLVLCACLLIMGSTTTVNAQSYKNAIGIKGGYPGYGSLNFKHFMSSSTALELSVGGNNHYFWGQGLYEIQAKLGDGFEWYYGIGADLGSYNNNYYYNYNNKYYNGGFFLGIDGVLGIEYTFKALPLNIAFDVQPTVRVVPYFRFGVNGAFALRFAIK
jgi:hypothetical protein